MIKIAKIDTLFMTKTAKKPYHLGPRIHSTYISHIREHMYLPHSLAGIIPHVWTESVYLELKQHCANLSSDRFRRQCCFHLQMILCTSGVAVCYVVQVLVHVLTIILNFPGQVLVALESAIQCTDLAGRER